jgi:hypothetical protein
MRFDDVKALGSKKTNERPQAVTACPFDRVIMRSTQAFKGGHIHDEQATGSEHAAHLCQRPHRIDTSVVEHIEGQHRIEDAILIRHLMDAGDEDLVQSAFAAELDGFRGEVTAMRLPSVKPREHAAGAATGIKQTATTLSMALKRSHNQPAQHLIPPVGILHLAHELMLAGLHA